MIENGYEEYLRRYYINPKLSDDASEAGVPPANVIDPARLRLGPCGGIHDFFAIYYSIMKLDSPDIVNCPAYPDNVIAGKAFAPTVDNPTPKIPTTITWKVINRKFAPIRGGKTSTRREMKVRVKEEVATYDDDEVVTTVGNDYSNIVQFDCWEKTHYQSELLASYFEYFMVQYASLFKEHGVKEVLFEERMQDSELMVFKIPVISVRYYVITEQLYLISTKRIQEIRTKFNSKDRL